ncbi:hypothetical protein ACWC4E_35715, partial [Streptomyces sp. NPDC001273]|uniref:hypothetical protein n=1 Tax=unclassified Streptomyces TaxID=2593676 RepID=UPI00340F9758
PSDQDQVQAKTTERVTFDPPSEGHNSGVAEIDTQIRLPSRFQDAEQKFQNATEEKRRKWFGDHVNDFRTCGLSSESFDTVS